MKASIISTDYFLIHHSLIGDRKKQKELYDIYSTKMFKTCVRYTRNETEAEEVFQQGFVHLFNNLGKYNSEENFEVWIRRVFVNTAIDHLKRNTLTIMEGPIRPKEDKQKEALENITAKGPTSTANTLSVVYRSVDKMYAIKGFYSGKAALANSRKTQLYIA